MSVYRFDTERVSSIEGLILNEVGEQFILKEARGNDRVVIFHNGDRMDIDLTKGTMDYDTAAPGQLGHSKLSLRLHQWFGKGIIHIVQ